MAARLGLEGVAFRPAAYHLAYGGRDTLQFVDPARQGRFEALVEALRGLPLTDATRAVAEGRVRLNGAKYEWETDEMVHWLEPRDEDRAAVEGIDAGFLGEEVGSLRELEGGVGGQGTVRLDADLPGAGEERSAGLERDRDGRNR